MRRVNQIYLRRCMKLQRTMDVGLFGSNARGTFLFLPRPACWMESRRHIMTPPPLPSPPARHSLLRLREHTLSILCCWFKSGVMRAFLHVSLWHVLHPSRTSSNQAEPGIHKLSTPTSRSFLCIAVVPPLFATGSS